MIANLQTVPTVHCKPCTVNSLPYTLEVTTPGTSQGRGHMWYMGQYTISLHEGLEYACIDCDLTETQLDNLPHNIGMVYRGKRYSCNQLKWSLWTRMLFHLVLDCHIGGLAGLEGFLVLPWPVSSHPEQLWSLGLDKCYKYKLSWRWHSWFCRKKACFDKVYTLYVGKDLVYRAKDLQKQSPLYGLTSPQPRLLEPGTFVEDLMGLPQLLLWGTLWGVGSEKHRLLEVTFRCSWFSVTSLLWVIFLPSCRIGRTLTCLSGVFIPILLASKLSGVWFMCVWSIDGGASIVFYSKFPFIPNCGSSECVEYTCSWEATC